MSKSTLHRDLTSLLYGYGWGDRRLSSAHDDAADIIAKSKRLHRWHEALANGDIRRDIAGKFRHYCESMDRCRQGAVIVNQEEIIQWHLDGMLSTRYPSLSFYIQPDPRGCPLYIIRPGDIPEGKDVEAYYSRGFAVTV